MSNDEHRNQKYSVWKIVCFSAVAGLFVMIVLLAILAAFTSSGKIGEGSMKAGACVACVLGSFCGASIAAMSRGSHILPTSMISGGVLAVAVLTIGFFSSGNWTPGGMTVSVLLCIASGSTAGGLICATSKRCKRK